MGPKWPDTQPPVPRQPFAAGAFARSSQRQDTLAPSTIISWAPKVSSAWLCDSGRRGPPPLPFDLPGPPCGRHYPVCHRDCRRRPRGERRLCRRRRRRHRRGRRHLRHPLPFLLAAASLLLLSHRPSAVDHADLHAPACAIGRAAYAHTHRCRRLAARTAESPRPRSHVSVALPPCSTPPSWPVKAQGETSARRYRIDPPTLAVACL